MKKSLFLAGIVLAAAACSDSSSNAPTDPNLSLQDRHEEFELNPDILPGKWAAHAFMDRNAGKNAGGKGGAANLINHGGTVFTTSKEMAIFWGPEWNDPAFAGDVITGFDTFYQGWSGSNYAGTNTEYSGSNGKVTKNNTYLGHTIDASAAPTGELSTTAAVNEACKITGNNPDPNALYLIYTPTYPSGVGYCAWHTWGNCSNGKPVQAAYMPNTGGQAGCDPADTWTNHSQKLASLANVSGHELSEAITDPRGQTWFDRAGQENSDKCAWAFKSVVTFSNGSQWKIQGNWSNAAYTAGTGYANRQGQKGCLQG